MKRILSALIPIFFLAGGSWLYIPNATPPFTPSDITGRIFQFYAVPANVTLSGSDVNQWNDISGNGLNATPGNPSLKPTYISGAINGMDAVSFSGTTQGQTLGFSNSQIYSSARGFTLYMVFKHNVFNVAGAGNILLTGKIDSSADFPVFGYDHVTLGYFWSGNPVDVGQFAFWSVPEDTASWHVAAFVYNGSGYGTATNTSMYFDKVLQTTTTFATTQYGANNTIASYDTGGLEGYSFNGNIAFMMGFDHAASGTELSNLNNWALSVYGL